MASIVNATSISVLIVSERLSKIFRDIRIHIFNVSKKEKKIKGDKQAIELSQTSNEWQLGSWQVSNNAGVKLN